MKRYAVDVHIVGWVQVWTVMAVDRRNAMKRAAKVLPHGFSIRVRALG